MQSGQQPESTPEQKANDQSKQILFETFVQMYRNLSDFINKIPFHPSLKVKIMDRFDDGFLWAKESFTVLDLGIKANPPSV